MTTTSKNTPGSYDYKTEKAAFIIPQETYNKMLCDILGIKKIDKAAILSLLSIQESIKSKIFTICANQGFTENDLLERSRVGMRKEKNNENRLLLRNGKQNLFNIDGKSDAEIVLDMKGSLNRQIDKYSGDVKAYWPDGSINYSLTMDNIVKMDNNKISHAEAVKNAKKKNKEKGRLIANTLSDSDFKLLDDILFEALRNSNKLSKGTEGNTVLRFLKINFPEIPKLHTKKAQEYFSDKYYPMYDEKYPDKLQELYPHDRKIVILPLSKSGKKICKVRGEKEIIALTAKKIDEWKIDILSYVDTHVNQQKVEMLIQELINIYYEILHNVSIYNFKSDSDNKKRQFELDLEDISENYRELKGKEIGLLNREEFNEKLLNNAKFNLDLKINKNPRTAKLDKFDYSKIPHFEGFSSILEFYKEYFINRLNSSDQKTRIRKPGRREILEKFGYTVTSIDKAPNSQKITIVTDNKKAS